MLLPKGNLEVQFDEHITVSLDLIEYQLLVEKETDPEASIRVLQDRILAQFGYELPVSQAWCLLQAINVGYLEYKKKFDHSLTSHFGMDLKLSDLTPEMQSFLETRSQDIGPVLSNSSESPNPQPRPPISADSSS